MSIIDPQPGERFDATGQLITDAPPAVTDQPGQPTEVPTAAADNQPPSVAQQPDINWESVLAEKTNGKFKSWDEILPKITAEPTQPVAQELTFANEESKIAFENLKSGNVDEVLRVYNEQRRLANLENMSERDALKVMLEYKNPSFTQEDIEEEVATRYAAEKPEAPEEDDYIDDEAFEKAQKQYQKDLVKYEKDQKKLERQLKLDAQNAKEYLSSLKKDIILPDINPVHQSGPSEEDLQAQREAAQAERQSYLDSLKKTSAEFKEIPFEVSDEGVNFKGVFHIDENDRALLAKDLAEKNVIDDLIVSRYVKEDGYNTRQLMEDIYFLNNKEKIIQAAIKQAIAQTDLDNIKKLKNIDLEQRSSTITGPSQEAQQRELVKAFFEI